MSPQTTVSFGNAWACTLIENLPVVRFVSGTPIGVVERPRFTGFRRSQIVPACPSAVLIRAYLAQVTPWMWAGWVPPHTWPAC